jgi:predicted amidohydrolase YtcJ
MRADKIWFNAVIRTLDPSVPAATALASKDGKIIAVGRDTDVLNLSGPETQAVDLGGRTVLPGFVESHTHALWGACQDLYEVNVNYGAAYGELVAAVKQRVARSSGDAMITGGPWRHDMRPKMGASPRAALDAISTEVPIALADVTKHLLWCNSRALELAGLHDGIEDIEGGIIERDPKTGAPNGILAETACAPVRRLFTHTPEELARATRYFVERFNRLGFTAFKEPMAIETDLAAYQAADQRGDLTLHMAAHLVRQSPLVPEMIPYDEMERWRRVYASPNVRTDFAKLFLDGVAPGFTASFTEPYLAASGYDADNHDADAILLLTPEAIAQEITELDRRGFTVKMHAVGDNAIRRGLDGIEAARRENGSSGLRHEIAHAPFIRIEDLGRFSVLDAVAEVSPKLWYPNPATQAQTALLGEDRVSRCHALRDYLNANINVTYASDWPAASPDPNPWIGLAGMISRQDPFGNYPGSLGPEQAITLDQALPLFTINGAHSLRMGEETGSISVGKSADFIVLDAPLESLSPAEIAAVEVRETVWKSQTVFAR